MGSPGKTSSKRPGLFSRFTRRASRVLAAEQTNLYNLEQGLAHEAALESKREMHRAGSCLACLRAPGSWRKNVSYWVEAYVTGSLMGKVGLFFTAGVGLLVVLSEGGLILTRHVYRTRRRGANGLRHLDERIRWRSQSYWYVFGGLTDPGNVAEAGGAKGDASYYGTMAIRAYAGVVSMAGLLFMAALVGFIVEAIQTALGRATRGLSPVVETDHVLIIGYTDKCVEVIQELCLAMESEGGGVIVILADEDAGDCSREIKEALPARKLRGSQVKVRRGDPQFVPDLDRVSAAAARSIIVCSPGGLEADRADCTVLRTVLALRAAFSRRGHEPPSLIAELQDIDNRHVLEVTGGECVECVVSHDICSRLLLTTSRHPGLGQVYEHVFGFEGNEFYMREWPELVGRTFGELVLAFPDAVPLGFRKRDGSELAAQLQEEHGLKAEDVEARHPMLKHGLILNPPRDLLFEDGDELVVLAADDDTYHPEKSPPRQTQRGPERDLVVGDGLMTERILMCNWRRDIDDMILLLENEVKGGTELHICANMKVEDREEQFRLEGFDPAALRNLSLVHHVGRPSVKRDLEQLPIMTFDSVLILADQRHEDAPLEADAENLATLLLIRDIRRQCAKEANEGEEAEAPPPKAPLRRGDTIRIQREKISIKQNMFLASRKSSHLLKDKSARGRKLMKEALTDVDGCSICCELLDTRTATMTSVNDLINTQAEYILSHGICAKILAMVAMRREVKLILDELLDDDGMSPVVFPISRLEGLDLPSPSKRASSEYGRWSFAHLAERALDSRVLLLGYQLVSAGGGLVLNPPDKHAAVGWHRHDLLVGE